MGAPLPWIVTRPPALPVERMLRGRPAEEAAATLPRLFSLCRAAQAEAARRAMGLPVDADLVEARRRELVRDHLLKLCLGWPRHFGASDTRLPVGWESGAPEARWALFGSAGRFPERPEDFRAFLRSGTGVAGVLARVAGSFRPFEADPGPLPAVTGDAALDLGPVENSAAARQAAHPVLRDIAASGGHGPLWRATVRALDLSEALMGRGPEAVTRPGLALVPTARGLYALAVTLEEGRVAALRRVTPTDHLLAAGGVLDRSLARLCADRAGLLPLLLDILDPCAPVDVAAREVAHA